jgi:hypothetical protein|tara:strand:+ start:461 stop:631 length:171 start_codon:yes stop_codon:yes gene_type:complete
MIKLLLFLFLISCSSPISNYDLKNKTLDFNKDLTIDEFNQLLIEYAKINPYPNIEQ